MSGRASPFVEALEFRVRVPGGPAHVRVVRVSQQDGPGAWRADVEAETSSGRRESAAYAHGPTAEAALRTLARSVRLGADFVERVADAIDPATLARIASASSSTVNVGGVLVDPTRFLLTAADDVVDALARGEDDEVDAAVERLRAAVLTLRGARVGS